MAKPVPRLSPEEIQRIGEALEQIEAQALALRAREAVLFGPDGVAARQREPGRGQAEPPAPVPHPMAWV